MRLKALLTDDDSAVSPVIGVILMVAITVILAAVIASFVLGLGPSDVAPTVNFDSEYDGSALTVEVVGGDTVPVDQISYSGDASGDWTASDASGTVDGQTAIQSGDTRTISSVSEGDEVNIVWTSEDGGTTQTLTTINV